MLENCENTRSSRSTNHHRNSRPLKILDASNKPIPPAADLGYDPKPHVKLWRGTPIPPVDRPLRLTPERSEICNRIWWWGGPENALRNCRHYLYHVIDYGRMPDWKFTMVDVDREIWLYALETSREGLLSRGGHRLFAVLLHGDITHSDNWSMNGHRNDIARELCANKWIRERGKIVA